MIHTQIHTPLENIIHIYDPYFNNCKSWTYINLISEFYLWNSSISILCNLFWIRDQNQLFDTWNLYLYIYIYSNLKEKPYIEIYKFIYIYILK